MRLCGWKQKVPIGVIQEPSIPPLSLSLPLPSPPTRWVESLPPYAVRLNEKAGGEEHAAMGVEAEYVRPVVGCVLSGDDVAHSLQVLGDGDHGGLEGKSKGRKEVQDEDVRPVVG